MTLPFRVAIITGASSGIGFELAKVLAQGGCKVGVLARRQEQLDELVKSITDSGQIAISAVADVADREATHTAIRRLTEQLGPVDLLVANAGVGAPTTVNPVNFSAFEKMYRVNVFGVVHALDAVLPEMMARKSGHVAAVSSLAGYKGLPGEWGYTSSKAAVNNLMEGLRVQLREYNIAVTNICPGFIKTPMTAKNQFHMPFLLEADDAARRIVRALVRKKKVFNFPWQMSLFMWFVRNMPDWLLARGMRPYNENPPFPDQPL